MKWFYIDNKGIVRETISEEIAVQGGGDSHSIGLYIEDTDSDDSVTLTIKTPDGSTYDIGCVRQRFYAPDSDMRFFQPNARYWLWVAKLEPTMLATSGLTIGTAVVSDGNVTTGKGMITFMIEDSAITDADITLSQYLYLLSQLGEMNGRFVLKTGDVMTGALSLPEITSENQEIVASKRIMVEQTTGVFARVSHNGLEANLLGDHNAKYLPNRIEYAKNEDFLNVAVYSFDPTSEDAIAKAASMPQAATQQEIAELLS